MTYVSTVSACERAPQMQKCRDVACNVSTRLRGRDSTRPTGGAWYAGFELETVRTEVPYHRRLWLQETAREEEDTADYLDYLADFHAEFDDLRGAKERWDYLDPDDYRASQAQCRQRFGGLNSC